MHRPGSPLALLLFAPLLLLAACQTPRPAAPAMEPGPAPTVAAVKTALDQWPHDVSRRFTMKLVLSGREYAATGTLDYSDPFDFRIAAGTDSGPLFDVRYNWAGIKILRLSPIMDRERISAIIADLSRALRLPPQLESSRLAGNTLVVERSDSDEQTYTWTFGPSAHLRTLNVALDLFDNLEVQFPTYTSRDWPASLTVYRFWRNYALYISFSDIP
jgi:hypothetical protein